jgi:hypothetical protein
MAYDGVRAGALSMQLEGRVLGTASNVVTLFNYPLFHAKSSEAHELNLKASEERVLRVAYNAATELWLIVTAYLARTQRKRL